MPRPYSLDQMPWLLYISSCDYVQLLFKSGYYLRVAFIKLGTKMKKSTASRKVEWLQMPVSQSEETLPSLPLQCIPSSRNHTPFADVEGDEDELEEKELVLED